jgi:subtilisin family serine protease
MLKRPLLLLTVFATVSAAFATAAAAEQLVLEPDGSSKDVQPSETGSYIVVMEEDPVVVSVGQENLDSSAADALADDLVADQDEVLEDIGADVSEKVNTYTNALNGFSAVLSYEEAQAIAANPKVALVLPDELHQADTNSSPDYLGLTRPGGAYDSGLDGEGVVVGVIDSGIWPEHASFADDGSYGPHPVQPLDNSRPDCEFGNTAHNSADVPFTCNNKLLGARQMLDTYRAVIGADPGEYDSARDENGHGTHTASTAAGNAGVPAAMYGKDLGEITGIAPRSRVIAYKGLGALGGFTSDLAAAIDQAVSDGVDVINYSIGGGSSLPVGADEIAFLFAANAGVFVATSAGNSGPGSDTVGSPGNSPWLTTVAASTQNRFYPGEIHTSYGDRITGASLTPGVGTSPLVDAEDAGGDLCLAGTLDPAKVAGAIVLCRRGAIARAAKSQNVLDAGGVGMVLYNNDDDDNLFTDTHVLPSVHINNSDGVEIKAHIDEEQALGHDVEAEIRKTAKTITARGAPSVTYFSSRGQNGPVPDIIKPDITAPGHQILAGDSPTANAVGDSFQAISGTSMSSPHVAGLFALLKQAHPDWSAAAAKSAIMTSADRHVHSEDRKTQATPTTPDSSSTPPSRAVPTSGSSHQGRASSSTPSGSHPMPAISTWHRSASPSSPGRRPSSAR